MSTSRCPVVRRQAEPYGSQGFTTDYHDWSGPDDTCAFCGVTRRGAQGSDDRRPGWEGIEADRLHRELQLLLADLHEANPAFVPDRGRWTRLFPEA
jgi:hypothetical protein